MVARNRKSKDKDKDKVMHKDKDKDKVMHKDKIVIEGEDEVIKDKYKWKNGIDKWNGKMRFSFSFHMILY